MPGPVPKRSTQRRRANKESQPDILTVPTPPTVAAPADAEWHPVARDWYNALGRSGQSHFYEPSDWATARYIAEAMSRNLLAGRFSGQLFAAVLSGMTELLTTEGARRRARVELEHAVAETDTPQAAIMAKYKLAAVAQVKDHNVGNAS